MRVNDQEDIFMSEASRLPYPRPGGMTWARTCGACWSACCRRGRRRDGPRNGPGGSSSRVVDARWTPPVTLGVRLVSVLNDDMMHAGQATHGHAIVLRARAS
jgi:hypothetical protein